MWTLGFCQATSPPLLHHPGTLQPHPPNRKTHTPYLRILGVVEMRDASLWVGRVASEHRQASFERWFLTRTQP